MLRRRQLNYVFDSIKCDTWVNILERNGYAAEKNLALQDCYLTLQQLPELKDGHLMKKVCNMESILHKHLDTSACKSCKLDKHTCQVCNGNNG